MALNPLADLFDGLVKRGIEEGKAVVYAGLVARFPFLALPGISLLTKAIIGRIADKLYEPTAKVVVDGTIDGQINGQDTEYKKALDALRAAAAKGAKDELDRRTREWEAKLALLIHHSGKPGKP